LAPFQGNRRPAGQSRGASPGSGFPPAACRRDFFFLFWFFYLGELRRDLSLKEKKFRVIFAKQNQSGT
jgi:hypothetical protein